MHVDRPKIPLWIILVVTTISLLSSFFLVSKTLLANDFISFSSFVPQIQKSVSVKPIEAIVIHFPKPVFDNTYRQRIHINPSLPFYAKWEDNQTKLLLTPQSNWDPGTRYTVTLPEGSSSNPFSSIPQTAIFDFQTVPYPTVTSVTPKDGTTDVVVDIEDPVVVTFDTPLEDFWVDFVFSPNIDVTFQNNPEKTRFEILPKSAFSPGTLYTLTILSRVKESDSSTPKQIYQTKFTTLPPAPTEISQNINERLAQAKRFTPAQITQGKYIDINIASQVMTLFENGSAINAYLISSGKRGMDTPKGSFQIHNKALRPWSKAHSLYMPYWMAITSDGKYGIHELPEWPGGYKEGANHLGIPVSHGCVRLGIGPAEYVYNWAEIGTPVIIH